MPTGHEQEHICLSLREEGSKYIESVIPLDRITDIERNAGNRSLKGKKTYPRALVLSPPQLLQ
jgi:hypothetical protein